MRCWKVGIVSTSLSPPFMSVGLNGELSCHLHLEVTRPCKSFVHFHPESVRKAECGVNLSYHLPQTITAPLLPGWCWQNK